MYSLTRARNDHVDAGEPIPSPYPSLDAAGIHVRREQLALIAGGSGTGKTAFVLNWAVRANVPTLYFSADSDAFTMYARAASMLTGWRMVDVYQCIEEGNTRAVDATLDGTLDAVRFDFNRHPTLEHIDTLCESYGMVYGSYPHLLVVDNLRNIENEVTDGKRDYNGSLDFLHELAGEIGCAVVVLHHVVGQYADGVQPIPMSGLLEKTDKTPELILTLHKKNMGGTLGVCPVKNRMGRMDPSGGWVIDIGIDLDSMQFNDNGGSQYGYN